MVSCIIQSCCGLSNTYIYLFYRVVMQISSHSPQYTLIFHLWFYQWGLSLLSIPLPIDYSGNATDYLRKEQHQWLSYGLALYFLYSLFISSNSMPDEKVLIISWSSLLFEICMIKKCVVFSLTSFYTWKYLCVINTFSNTTIRISF